MDDLKTGTEDGAPVGNVLLLAESVDVHTGTSNLTDNPTANVADSVDDRERARRIAETIRKAEQRLRARYPILNYQNFLGALILLVSASCFIFTSILYVQGIIPAWACILLNAIFTSILHELEHDLIHNLYFRTRPLIKHTMMLLVWVFRGNTINPWYRRHLHLLHHRESGNSVDLEERLIGNGMRYGFFRLLSTVDGLIGSLLRWGELTKVPACSPGGLFRAGLPMMALFWLVWYGWLILNGAMLAMGLMGFIQPTADWLTALTWILNVAVVIYAAPNLLRSACLNLISSSMHYYGDVRSTLQQTQVLNHWIFWPLQIFCFNFGSTHALHHFVIVQPFYLRQMVARVAHKAMKEHGVRFNDFGTFTRINRYQKKVKHAS